MVSTCFYKCSTTEVFKTKHFLMIVTRDLPFIVYYAVDDSRFENSFNKLINERIKFSIFKLQTATDDGRREAKTPKSLLIFSLCTFQITLKAQFSHPGVFSSRPVNFKLSFSTFFSSSQNSKRAATVRTNLDKDHYASCKTSISPARSSLGFLKNTQKKGCRLLENEIVRDVNTALSVASTLRFPRTTRFLSDAPARKQASERVKLLAVLNFSRPYS